MNKYLRYIFFLLITVNTAFAFNTTGKISGRVKDANTGEPLPFVNVIIEGTTLGAASDVDGYYTIVNVAPGTYSLKASAIGYNSVTMQNVKVSIGLTTSIDFNLAETSISLKSDVVVIAEKPLIQKDLTASTSIVDGETISALPVTDLGDILQLQAGVVTSSDGQIHMRGGRAGQVAYQIDGVPVTDAYDNSNVIDVATNSIQELQVVSGAFNAEFGQAMSGIVNIVTKDGGNEFTGNFQTYAGDFISNKTDKFWNIDEVKPTAIRNIEGSLSGPVIPNQLFFFVNGRYYYNQGHLYGRREFLTTDFAGELEGSGGSDYFITHNGDGAFVPMNPDERYFGQGKLTSRLFTGFKVSYNLIFDRQEYKEYNNDNRLRRLTPDNNLKRFRKGYTNTLAINHAISQNSFYNLNLSYFFKDYRHYLYEDIFTGDPNRPTNYVNNFITQAPPYSFEVGGTDYSRFTRNTSTYSAKLDWTTQMNKEINVQFGGELRQHRIYLHDMTIFPYYDDNGRLYMGIPPFTSPDNDTYLHWPQEGSAYLQSKFEAYSLIFNIGVRYDIFNPDGKVLTDASDPNINAPLKPANRFFDNNHNGVLEPELGETEKTLADRQQYWYKDASVKSQISPRIGIAFPISDKGVIHFSYGHFLQLPSYERMYENPEFELGSGSGNQGLFGNADLRPQKTVKGEIGLQQQIGENISVDVTLFFEDFRDLTGTQSDEILVFGRGSSYSKYANTDFGSSKGFIVKIDQRLSGGLAVSLDYTYSVTIGNSSNPGDARDALTRGVLPETFIAPLNWDQPHTLNISASYSQPRNFGLSLIANIYSGQPFTPAVNKNTNVTQNGFPTNSGYRPTVFNIDLRAYKDFAIGDVTITLFAKVYNLFDLDNPVNVYDNSGDPSFTFDKLDAQKTNPRMFYNTLDEYYTNPWHYSQPRRVEAGLSFNF